MKTVKVTKYVEEMVSQTIQKEVEMYVASDGTLHDSEIKAINYERYELCDKWHNVAEEFLKHEVILYNTREGEGCYLIHLANEDEYEKLCNALDYGENIDIGCLRLPHSFPVNRIMWIEWDALNCGWADDEDDAKDWLRWQIQDMEECIGGLKRMLNELNSLPKSVGRKEYAVEVWKDYYFIRQVDIFATLEEAKKFIQGVPVEDGESLNIIIIKYDENDNEIGTELYVEG